MLNQFGVDYKEEDYWNLLLKLNWANLIKYKGFEAVLRSFFDGLVPTRYMLKKKHTIRNGERLKVGDVFTPTVWSDKPYRSPQIIFFTDVTVKNIWKYDVAVTSTGEHWLLNGTIISDSNNVRGNWFNAGFIQHIAENDGLELVDFLNWFKHPANFDGQIICWDKDLEY